MNIRHILGLHPGRKFMIYTFDAKGCLFYPIMKSFFGLDDNDVYKSIQERYELLQKQLSIKKVSY